MAQLDKLDIEAALPKKGFEMVERAGHRYFHLKVNGRATGIKTYTSRGSSFKVYGDPLLAQMARELKIRKQDLVDLVECPLDGPGYLEKLRSQGIQI